MQKSSRGMTGLQGTFDLIQLQSLGRSKQYKAMLSCRDNPCMKLLLCAGGAVSREWQPSVRSIRTTTQQAVSPRTGKRKWNTFYPQPPPGQLWQGCPSITKYQHLFSPPLSPFLASPPLSHCRWFVCCARSMQGRKTKDGRVGGRVASSYNRRILQFTTNNIHIHSLLGCLDVSPDRHQGPVYFNEFTGNSKYRPRYITAIFPVKHLLFKQIWYS